MKGLSYETTLQRPWMMTAAEMKAILAEGDQLTFEGNKCMKLASDRLAVMSR